MTLEQINNQIDKHDEILQKVIDNKRPISDLYAVKCLLQNLKHESELELIEQAE